MNNVYVDVKCPSCGKITKIEMTNDQYYKYKNNNDLIQNIFPNLTPQIREMLITGICPDCWNKIFNYNDD